jgi:RNA polymerase sigma factor (sigma-70 family)
VVGKVEKAYCTEELASLLARARQGQPEAKEELFFFLRPRFLALAKYRITEEQDAEDIVQETLMVVDEHLVELGTVEHLLAFTGQVMRNKIGNFYQKTDRRSRYQAAWGEASDLAYYIDEELDAAELERVILKAIDQLSEKSPICRAILLGLRDGLSPTDLSQQLRLTRSQIDDRVFRCRQTLRRILLKDFQWRI